MQKVTLADFSENLGLPRTQARLGFLFLVGGTRIHPKSDAPTLLHLQCTLQTFARE